MCFSVVHAIFERVQAEDGTRLAFLSRPQWHTCMGSQDLLQAHRQSKSDGLLSLLRTPHKDLTLGRGETPTESNVGAKFLAGMDLPEVSV
jgi:hypothetical protein